MKNKELLVIIRSCIENGHYTLKAHQKQREKERSITRAEVLYVLKTGQNNPSRCGFNTVHQKDTYAIRERTVDGRGLEVIIAFDYQEKLEIITTYDLN